MFANRSILGSDAEMLTTHADCSWACLKSFADDSSCASGRVLCFSPSCVSWDAVYSIRGGVDLVVTCSSCSMIN